MADMALSSAYDCLGAASTLSLRRGDDSRTPGPTVLDPRQSSELARFSSSWSSWLLHDELLSAENCPDLARHLPEVPPIVVCDHSAGPSVEGDKDSGNSTLLSLGAVLEELELLAVQVQSLPLPRPPTPSLSDLCDALSLPIGVSIPSIDTELAEPCIAYDSSQSAKNTNSAPSAIIVYDFGQPSIQAHDFPNPQTTAVEDSGCDSGSSSPASSELSYYSDIERTPRSYYRPRAPSPLTPVTPDFTSFPTALPAAYSPYKETETPPASPAISEQFPPYLPPVTHTVPKAFLTVHSSSLDIARSAPPSKTKFRPIRSLILNRKRSQATQILQVPLPPSELIPRASLDAPRSAISFLDFTTPKRSLRRRNSEDLLSSRRTAAADVDTLQCESFLSFY